MTPSFRYMPFNAFLAALHIAPETGHATKEHFQMRNLKVHFVHQTHPLTYITEEGVFSVTFADTDNIRGNHTKPHFMCFALEQRSSSKSIKQLSEDDCRTETSLVSLFYFDFSGCSSTSPTKRPVNGHSIS